MTETKPLFWKSALAAIVVAASMCGLLAMEVNRRLDTSVADFESRHVAQVRALKHEVDSAFAVVRGLQAAAGSHIDHAEALTSTYAGSLGPVPGTGGYGLSGLPAPMDSAARLNLTGLGPLGSADLARELNVALTLEPFFRWVKGVYPETPWVYYLSARRFMAVYPYIPFADFFMDDAFFAMDLFRLGQPDLNPGREPYITPVYEDEAGQGAMVTFGAPVYLDTAFTGIVGFDLTVRSLSRVLRQHHHEHDVHSVIGPSGEVVARIDDAPERLDPAGSMDAPMDSETLQAVIRASAREQGPFFSEGRYRLGQRIANGGWVVVSERDRWHVWQEALSGSLPLFFFLLAIAGGGALYLRERHFQQRAATEGALRAERDKLQDMVDAKTHDLARSKDAAEAGAQAKAAFLANMSHEIRTPLNAVLGFAEIGQRDSREQTSQLCFHRIINSGELLLRVLDDVLDLSAIDAGKLALHEERFSLPATVADSVEMVAEKARSKSLALTVDIDDAMPRWFRGDRVRLQQILLNLLSNAVKFTDHGAVRVSVAWRDGQVRLDVSDTGSGLSDEDRERLFRPFEQADNSMTRRHGGSGLGLSIAHSLAHLMGGNVQVSSERGQGSSFCVTLPLVPVDKPSDADVVRPRLEQARLDGLTILVTDDDSVNRSLLDYLLSREGADVLFAENGLQAVKEVRTGHATSLDLVLMDIQMPVMDGYEATQRIGEIAPALPVVGLTAHVLPDDGEKCGRAGMVEHLAKPCDSETLVSTILRFTRKGKDGRRLPSVESP
ncbi:MAG: response regulator [Gammaproteobacteria bacterium]|nr:response regulator [Gammaproteobacteria bacterium]